MGISLVQWLHTSSPAPASGSCLSWLVHILYPFLQRVLVVPHVEAEKAADQQRHSKAHYSHDDQVEVETVESLNAEGIFHIHPVLTQKTAIQPSQHPSVSIEDGVEAEGSCEVAINLVEHRLYG